MAERVLAGDEAAAEAAMAREITAAVSAGGTPAPYPLDVVVYPAVGIEGLTLRAMRALGSADAVYFESTANSAVRHFARRDAEQHELDAKVAADLERVLHDTRGGERRVCIVCEETSADSLFAALAGAGRPFAR